MCDTIYSVPIWWQWSMQIYTRHVLFHMDEKMLAKQTVCNSCNEQCTCGGCVLSTAQLRIMKHLAIFMCYAINAALQQSTCAKNSTATYHGATACITIYAEHLWALCAKYCAQLHLTGQLLSTAHHSFVILVLRCYCVCYAVWRALVRLCAEYCAHLHITISLCYGATACVTLYAESTCECCWLGARGKESSQWWGGGASTGSQFKIE